MPPKQTLDKLAWLWAEQTDPSKVTLENIRTAYRVNLAPCPIVSSTCRKNCKGSPNCLNCLGEKAWIEKNLDEELKEALKETSSAGKRTPGTFIGLKNLGATCYANTFLQVWFHNPDFRRGILDWRNEWRIDSSSDSAQESFSAENLLSPVSIVEQLQLLFALLSFSDRQFIDPLSFIECLQLDTSLQQDAQEFSKLFISLLEDQLPVKDCYGGLNLIQHLFIGHYDYVTRCNGCGQESRSGSKFYEIDLNIKGHTTLAECMQEFLQEEKLDGENQYYCRYCLKKQDAVRRIHLNDLPPTLNFQLLRFVFDRQTQNKKKLMSYLQFPETLDMNEYMNPSGATMQKRNSDLVYDLVSVLIHRGPGAHSGHYVAVVKDCNTQATYRFNDEEVEKLADDRFRLETEEDNDGSKSTQKKPRTVKGYLSSRNAYMLVYRRRNNGAPTGVKAEELTLDSLSPHLQTLVEVDNQKHEESLRDQLETRKFYISKERERQEMVLEFYQRLTGGLISQERDDAFEWVSCAWLRDWLAADSMATVAPIDNSSFLCAHDRLHPDHVGMTKLIPKDAADLIFEKFGGCLHLPGFSSMCRQCVEEKCRFIHTKTMIAEDNKTIGILLKSKDSAHDSENSYWVGKKSLKNWRRMVEKSLELRSPPQKEEAEHDNELDDGGKESVVELSVKEAEAPEPRTAAGNGTASGNICDPVEMQAGETTQSTAGGVAGGDGDSDEDDNWSFNEDLLCPAHGNLSADFSTRRLIPANIWLLLRKYFPKAPEFIRDSPVCHFCKTQGEKERLFKEQDKAVAAELRLKLVDLYLDKKRPSFAATEVNQVNVISCRFLEEWRKFIRDPLRQAVAAMTDNASLLCNHSGFMYNVEANEMLNDKYVYIWPHEWKILTTYVEGDIEISVKKITDAHDQQRLIVQPEFCQKCCLERQQVEYSSQFTYENEVIYVRKVTDETRALFSRTFNTSKFPTAAHNTTIADGDGFAESPDDAEPENGKRKHPNGAQGEKQLRLEMPSSLAPIRRSARKGRVQDEIKFEVSSSQTLRDLKMQLVKAFSVMKMDQHLYLDGVELCDESATLELLRIRPTAVLYLKADEPSTETTFMDVSPVNSVEEGFKGTGLVGR